MQEKVVSFRIDYCYDPYKIWQKKWYHQYECSKSIENKHLIKAEYSSKILFLSIGYPCSVYSEGNWYGLIADSFCSTVLGISFCVLLPSMQNLKCSKCTRKDKLQFHV